MCWGEGDMWCALTAKNDHILTHITSRERMGKREEERQVEQQKHKGKVGGRAPSTDGIVQTLAVTMT